ncbi:MAG TPA: RNA polymerase sigma factor [Bryobacteraceae bacterium]|jgi:RNA polymerase sigma-70 factor (ECF subfamily)|nr:RNA polymerase sigma factor [Bryobacteraceae bacterium]HVW06954.1 RNA polymerase sigma factor [Bryobacteraceae bacterium]
MADWLMHPDSFEQARAAIEAIYESESRRVLATLIRLLGDFDLAEEGLHDAVIAAMEQWPRDGIPANPRAWLIAAGRFKGIDRIRRRSRFDAPLDAAAEQLPAEPFDPTQWDDPMEDDRLRLIFTCCHPALPREAQIALTLREVCGLRTEEIARAFLTRAPAIAKRIVRAKTKIRDAGIPYEVPTIAELPGRLGPVLQVVYLIFTEGYSASSGALLTRAALTGEAIRLGRLLAGLMPEPEVLGLLALMLLQESRSAARTSPEGEVILLEQQDRSLWNRQLIHEGKALLERALRAHRLEPYTLQAAIAAVHAGAPTAGSTDWTRITQLYDLLLQSSPSPVVELNRAVAVAMRDGPAAGLALIDAILERGELQDYYLAHSARGGLYERMGKTGKAVAAYQRALTLARQEPARRFLQRRLQNLAG